MTAPSRPRLLVFDWDGTLMDSIGGIVACTARVLADLGLEPLDEDLVRGCIGLGLGETMETLFPGHDAEHRERVMGLYRRHWIETYHAHGRLLDGVEDALDILARDGFWLAVATGKSRAGLDRDFRATGLGERFLATRTVSEAPSKPSPAMLLDLMDELGTRPGETLMIGDTTHDLDMARAAGCPSVAVCTGSHRRDALLGADPAACLESVCDLPSWLARR